MLTDFAYMVVKKIIIREMYNRKYQILILSTPVCNQQEFVFTVARNIDLSKYKKNDHVVVLLGLRTRGQSNKAEYFVKGIKKAKK